jgi:hypothetical protein
MHQFSALLEEAKKKHIVHRKQSKKPEMRSAGLRKNRSRIEHGEDFFEGSTSRSLFSVLPTQSISKL